MTKDADDLQTILNGLQCHFFLAVEYGMGILLNQDYQNYLQ